MGGGWFPLKGAGRVVHMLCACLGTRLQQAFKSEALLWKALVTLIKKCLHMLHVDFF